MLYGDNILNFPKDTQERLQRGFAKTFNAAGYNLGLTLTFSEGVGNTIDEETALKHCGLFLNELDKTYFGKGARKNRKIAREVFLHKTHAGGRWIHFHIFLKTLGNEIIFRNTIREIWTDKVWCAGEAHFEAYGHGAGFYGWKEDRHILGYESWQHTSLSSTGFTGIFEGKLKQAAYNRIYKKLDK